MITGTLATRVIKVDGKVLSPLRSQEIFNHSPDGFCWGYGGSGPAQLALALLLHFGCNEEEATRLYQEFKFDIVAKLPQGDFQMEKTTVATWIKLKGIWPNTPENGVADKCFQKMQAEREAAKARIAELENRCDFSAKAIEIMTKQKGCESCPKLKAAKALKEACSRLIQQLNALIGDSQGVQGLHMNGDLAPWKDLLQGGQYPWLDSLADAEEALEQGEEARI